MAKICPSCGYENFVGDLLCKQCGKSLSEQNLIPVPTTQLLGDHPHSIPANGVERMAHYGLLNKNNIALYVDKNEKPLIIDVEQRVTLGRNAGSQVIHPNIDLSNYGAYEKGVSRVHVMIRRAEKGLVLEDEGSSNGTWHNGIRIKPYVPVQLSPGDRISLSQLPLEIHFLGEPAEVGKAVDTNVPSTQGEQTKTHAQNEVTAILPREGRDVRTENEHAPKVVEGIIDSRFQGKFVLDMSQFDQQLQLIVRQVIDQLRAQNSCEVNVSIEVNARSKEPIDPDVRRTIYEASAKLNTLTSEFRVK